jgi:hypothetical protein
LQRFNDSGIQCSRLVVVLYGCGRFCFFQTQENSA